MNRKAFWLGLLKGLSLLLAICCFISLSQTYLFRVNKRDTLRLDGFRMEEKDSLDVVFIGASEIYTAFSPALAYEQCGFTSFPYSVASCPVTLWQTMLEDVLDRQAPQLIVVEINGAVYENQKDLYSNPAMHYVLDGMPLSSNKIRSIDRFCNEDTDTKACFYFPIIKYHSNWGDPQEQMENYENVRQLRSRGYSLLRGVSTTTKIAPPEELWDVMDDRSERDLNPVAEQSLRAFLDFCRERELPVLFVRFPHRVPAEEGSRVYCDFQKANRAGRIVQEYGFEYLNLEYAAAEIGIDPERDFYNSNHLNIYGQQKTTAYFARLLADRYGITPRPQSEEQRTEWARSTEYYARYCAYADELIKAGSGRLIAETAGLINQLEQLA